MTENTQWWDTRENLALMAYHMVACGYDASEIARAIDKPWSYSDDFELAVAEQQFPLTEESS